MLPAVYGKCDLCAGVIQSNFNVLKVFSTPVIAALDNHLPYGETADHLQSLIHIKPQRRVCLARGPAAENASFLPEGCAETALQDVPFPVESAGRTGKHVCEIRRNVSFYAYITVILMQMDCVP